MRVAILVVPLITRRVCWSSDGRFVFAAVGEGDADVVVFRGLKP
jgi:hypothetical protein